MRHPTSNSFKLALGSDSQGGISRNSNNILPKQAKKPEAEGEIKDIGENKLHNWFQFWNIHITANLAQSKVWSNNVSQQGMGPPYQLYSMVQRLTFLLLTYICMFLIVPEP
jgi:hypothetical protein